MYSSLKLGLITACEDRSLAELDSLRMLELLDRLEEEVTSGIDEEEKADDEDEELLEEDIEEELEELSPKQPLKIRQKSRAVTVISAIGL